MIQKAITKYGLAFHLAVLAAVPCSLAPFLPERALAAVILWLSLFAALWIFVEPSIRAGEHLSLARARVCASIAHDPVVWFLLLYVLLTAVRWFNSGMQMAYDPEKVAWTVTEPTLSIFPASIANVGLLPFAVAVGVTVLFSGVRHAIGLGARSSFALGGAVFAGLGGLAAAVFACLGIEPYAGDALQGFGVVRSPQMGSLFGIWILVAIGAGVLAEARKWKRGRVLIVTAIGGNVAGLVFFSPPLVAAAYLLVAALFAVFCLAWLCRVGSSVATARVLVFFVMGLLVPVFLVMAFSSDEFKKTKLEGLNPSIAWNAKVSNMDAVLSDVSKRLWLAEPWRGAGLGAFKLKAPFVVKREEWEVIPSEVERAVNGYWTILAERGNVMCGALALVLLLILWDWGRCGIGSWMQLRRDQDADAFPFACSPEVWLPILFIPLLATEGVFTSAHSVGTMLLAVVSALSLATASFSRRQTADLNNKEDN